MKTYWLFIILFLILCVGVAFVACGDNDDDDDDDSADDDDDASDNFICEGEVCTDSSSGYMWQKSGDYYDDWEGVKNYCSNLNLGGFSDWRVPTISELRSLIRGCPETETGGSCEVTDTCLIWDCNNDSCYECAYKKGPGPDGRYWPPELENDGKWYWSSSGIADPPEGGVWTVDFSGGHVSFNGEDDGSEVRCVR